MDSSLILDIVVGLLMVIYVIIGIKRGLISSLLNLVGYLASLALSWWLSGKLAVYVYENYVKKIITDTVESKISGVVEGSGAAQLPSALSSLLGDKLGAGLSEQSVADISGSFVDETLASPATTVVRVILCVLLFIVLSFVIKLLTRAFRGVNKVPVLGAINRLGGAVVGAVEGVIICYIAVLIVSLIITVTGDSLPALNTEVVGKSRLFSLLYNYNPLNAIEDSGILEIFKK